MDKDGRGLTDPEDLEEEEEVEPVIDITLKLSQAVEVSSCLVYVHKHVQNSLETPHLRILLTVPQIRAFKEQLKRINTLGELFYEARAKVTGEDTAPSILKP